MKKIISNFINKRSSLIFCLLVIFLFVLLIYFTFGQSLHLSLWGDDWEMLWIVKNYYDASNQFHYLLLSGYVQPWGVMNLLLMINKHFFGYSAYGYYLVSMILRAFSAFAGYLFLSKFNKSKLIGLIGGLFVLVGYTGIESTNYTIHMNTYLVPMFTFLTLIFLIESYKGKFWKFLLGCLLFALSLAASPLRSHGLLPFIIIFDVLFGLTIMKVNLKQILFRQMCLFLAFLIIYKLGFFGSTGLSFINMPVILQMVKEGNYTFVSAFITTLGKTFFPDLYVSRILNIIHLFGANWVRCFVITGFLAEALALYFIVKIAKRNIKEFYIVFCTLLLCFLTTTLILEGFYWGDELLVNLTFTFLGIFFLTILVLGLYVLFISRKRKVDVAWLGVVAGPILIFTSIIVPLLSTPGRVLESNHRYLTLSLVGVSIAVASLLKLAMDNSKKIFIFLTLFLMLLLVVNIKADRKYFSTLYLERSPSLAYSEWDQFNKYMQHYFQNYPDKLLLFYVDDSESEGIARDTFIYGFGLRVALEHDIRDQSKVPAFTVNYDEVVSTVTDGKAFLRLGYPQKKIGVDQVYAFKITKNGDLLDITQKTRKDLTEEVKKYKSGN